MVVVFPAFEEDSPVANDQSMARAAKSVDVGDDVIPYRRERHDDRGNLAGSRVHEHIVVSVAFAPLFPVVCLLLEIVVANVGMIYGVVACIGSERAIVMLPVACATSKRGSNRAIFAWIGVVRWAQQGRGHSSNINIVISYNTVVCVRCHTAVQTNAKTVWAEVAPPVDAA